MSDERQPNTDTPTRQRLQALSFMRLATALENYRRKPVTAIHAAEIILALIHEKHAPEPTSSAAEDAVN